MQPGYFADVRISIRFQLFKIVFFSHFSDELILMANRITAIFNWLNCRLVVYNHKTLPYLDSFFLICFTGLLIKLLRFLRRFARFSFSFQINCRFIRLQSTVSKREVFNTKRQFNELIVSSRYALFLMEILIWLVVMRGNKRCLSYVFVLSLLPLLFHSESFLEIDFIVKKCRWELIKSGTLENDLLYSEFDDDKMKKKNYFHPIDDDDIIQRKSSSIDHETLEASHRHFRPFLRVFELSILYSWFQMTTNELRKN